MLQEHLLERHEKAGGGAIRNPAEALLRSLGFDEGAWRCPMELLSGQGRCQSFRVIRGNAPGPAVRGVGRVA